MNHRGTLGEARGRLIPVELQAILVEYAKQSFIEMKFEEESPYFILETAPKIEQRSAGKLSFDQVVEDHPYSKRYLSFFTVRYDQ